MRKALSEAASDLLNSARTVYQNWSASDKIQREGLYKDYQDKRSNLQRLADRILHNDEIFQAAQDTLNRCDIVVYETTQGPCEYQALTDAHECTKALLILLASDSEEKS